MRLKVEKQAEYRKARIVVVTCTDNRDVEGQLSVGSRYEVQSVIRYGAEAYYQIRNDGGDLASYGTHRFDVRPCDDDLQLKSGKN